MAEAEPVGNAVRVAASIRQVLEHPHRSALVAHWAGHGRTPSGLARVPPRLHPPQYPLGHCPRREVVVVSSHGEVDCRVTSALRRRSSPTRVDVACASPEKATSTCSAASGALPVPAPVHPAWLASLPRGCVQSGSQPDVRHAVQSGVRSVARSVVPSAHSGVCSPARLIGCPIRRPIRRPIRCPPRSPIRCPIRRPIRRPVPPPLRSPIRRPIRRGARLPGPLSTCRRPRFPIRGSTRSAERPRRPCLRSFGPRRPASRPSLPAAVARQAGARGGELALAVMLRAPSACLCRWPRPPCCPGRRLLVSRRPGRARPPASSSARQEGRSADDFARSCAMTPGGIGRARAPDASRSQFSYPAAPFLQSPKSVIKGHGKSRLCEFDSAVEISLSSASTAPIGPPLPPTFLVIRTPGSGSSWRTSLPPLFVLSVAVVCCGWCARPRACPWLALRRRRRARLQQGRLPTVHILSVGFGRPSPHRQRHRPPPVLRVPRRAGGAAANPLRERVPRPPYLGRPGARSSRGALRWWGRLAGSPWRPPPPRRLLGPGGGRTTRCARAPPRRSFRYGFTVFAPACAQCLQDCPYDMI
eukprot:2235925-Pleurochrysis_carterae.AAC.2